VNRVLVRKAGEYMFFSELFAVITVLSAVTSDNMILASRDPFSSTALNASVLREETQAKVLGSLAFWISGARVSISC